MTQAEEVRQLWIKEPRAFVKAFWPHIVLYPKQEQILESVRDNVETYVPAGNMLGKDFISGLTALWYFTVFDVVRVVTTSVKDDHLRVLWGEIGTFLDTAVVPLREEQGGPFKVNHNDIRKVAGSAESRSKSYLRGMVSKTGEGMAGHHAPKTLLIVDEASGVDDSVHDQGMTWAKRLLVIGNPNPCTNFFFRGVTAGDLLNEDTDAETPPQIQADE